MVEIRTCACGCGLETGRRAKTGRIPVYATNACRVRALRSRRIALASLEQNATLETATELIASASVSVASTSTDEQVARSILEARSIGFAFQRLGATARPELAWRCSKVGDAIVQTLTENFPER